MRRALMDVPLMVSGWSRRGPEGITANAIGEEATPSGQARGDRLRRRTQEMVASAGTCECERHGQDGSSLRNCMCCAGGGKRATQTLAAVEVGGHGAIRLDGLDVV